MPLLKQHYIIDRKSGDECPRVHSDEAKARFEEERMRAKVEAKAKKAAAKVRWVG